MVDTVWAYVLGAVAREVADDADADHRFEWGLTCVLDGLAANANPTR